MATAFRLSSRVLHFDLATSKAATWLNVYQISCALVAIATADVRYRGTDYWAGPDWYSARAHKCGAGRALISGLR